MKLLFLTDAKITRYYSPCDYFCSCDGVMVQDFYFAGTIINLELSNNDYIIQDNPDFIADWFDKKDIDELVVYGNCELLDN